MSQDSRSENRSPRGIITSHLNADFDAVASCLAASLLYPGLPVVLPGGMERAVRRFLDAHPGVIRVHGPKELDLSRVRQLVVVDTNQRGRLGPLGELLKGQGVEIILFDHHMEAQSSILMPEEGAGGLKGQDGRHGQQVPHIVEAHTAATGANTTIMVELLREKGLEISRQQATLLALGIYEDTGSFTFVSTTPRDLKAAAWLLSKGADLTAVSEAMGARFTPEHISLLNDLMQSALTYTFRGTDVTIAKAASLGYVDDFAVLAHELMDMASLPVVFILGQMGDQVVVVGRSRCEKIDVGRVLAELGGGGHGVAASAALKGLTLAEAENRLVEALHKVLGTEPRVEDIMSYPVISVGPDTPIYEVHDLIARYGISIVPVADESGAMLGFVTRNIVEKAVFHGIAKQPVSEYMNTEFVPVAPEDSLGKVRELIVQGHQRFLPVVKDGRLTGIITRTDLLQILSSDPAGRPEKLLPGRTQRKNVARLLRQQLPAQIVELLEEAGRTADEMDCHVYVVGGFVRDLLLRRENLDIDLVVEGDGVAFARRFAQRIGARVKVHDKFKTAVLVIEDHPSLSGFKIDVATARFEYYEYPAAMPTVAVSSIKLDLFRRDFTINTLAIRLNSRDFGLLIDFFGGQRDLKDGVIRVLHSLSFVDDPTRIFRAIRFEKRFGFKIGKHTLRLIRNSLKIGILERLSGKRLVTELRHIMEEPEVLEILKRLQELRVLQAVHPALGLNEEILSRIKRIRDVTVWYRLLYASPRAEEWLVLLAGLVSGLDAGQRQAIARRLALAGKRARFIERGPADAKWLWQRLESRGEEMKNSEICALLSRFSIETLLLAMAWSEESERPKRIISLYITRLRHIRPVTTGQDLKRLGFTPGPIYRRILDRLKEARLNGEVGSRAQELELVEREFGPKKTDSEKIDKKD